MQKNQLTEIWIQSSSLSARLLIVTLMKEIKPVVTEKHHFDGRDESFLSTNFWKIQNIMILMWRSVSMVFQSIYPLQE